MKSHAKPATFDQLLVRLSEFMPVAEIERMEPRLTLMLSMGCCVRAVANWAAERMHAGICDKEWDDPEFAQYWMDLEQRLEGGQ